MNHRALEVDRLSSFQRVKVSVLEAWIGTFTSLTLALSTVIFPETQVRPFEKRKKESVLAVGVFLL